MVVPAQEYLNQVGALMRPYASGGAVIVAYNAHPPTTAVQAKEYHATIRRSKQELQLVKAQIAQTKRELHAAYDNDRIHITTERRKGCAGLFIRPSYYVKMNALKRNNLHQQEVAIVAEYTNAEQLITKSLIILDDFRLQIDKALLDSTKPNYGKLRG